jgi:hypothetical protein
MKGAKKHHHKKDHKKDESKEFWQSRGPYSVSGEPKNEKKMKKRSIIGKLLPKKFKTEKLTYD